MKTILVPTDFKNFDNALGTAVSFVQLTAGRIILMHNVETLLTNWSRLSQAEKLKHPDLFRYTAEVQKRLDEMLAAQLLNGIPAETLITYGVTSDEILATAVKVDAELIVMSSKKSKDSNVEFIGSTLQKVVRHAPCPVLSVKEEVDTKKLKRLVVPVSLDHDLQGPFNGIVKVATALGAVIQLLYVNSPQHFRTTGEIRKLMNNFKARYSSVPIETAVYDHMQVEAAILEFSELTRPDCIAMITFEHRRAPSYQLSTTDYVLHHATVPVIAVYDGAKMEMEGRPLQMV